MKELDEMTGEDFYNWIYWAISMFVKFQSPSTAEFWERVESLLG